MLVLTRKPEEDIVIRKKNQHLDQEQEQEHDDEIVVKILRVHSNKVSIGIKANKEWQIVRMELLDSQKNKRSKQDENSEQTSAVTEEELILVGAAND